MRRRLALVLFVIAGLLAERSAHAETVATLPAPTAYVNDFANVLSSSGQAQAEELCREVHERTRAQILVVTIHTLDGESIDTFANNLFHKWQIGDKATDRGVLLLLAVDDHKRRIEVGYGLEPILTDSKAGDFGRDMVPDLQASNYDGAVLLGVREVAQVIAADSHVTLPALDHAVPLAPVRASRGDFNPAWIVLIFVIAGLGMYGLILRAIYAGRRRMLSGRPFYRPDGSPGYTPYPSTGTFPISSGDPSSPITSSSDSAVDTSAFDSSSSSFDSSSDAFSGGGGGDSGGGGASGDW